VGFALKVSFLMLPGAERRVSFSRKDEILQSLRSFRMTFGAKLKRGNKGDLLLDSHFRGNDVGVR